MNSMVSLSSSFRWRTRRRWRRSIWRRLRFRSWQRNTWSPVSDSLWWMNWRCSGWQDWSRRHRLQEVVHDVRCSGWTQTWRCSAAVAAAHLFVVIGICSTTACIGLVSIVHDKATATIRCGWSARESIELLLPDMMSPHMVGSAIYVQLGSSWRTYSVRICLLLQDRYRKGKR